MQDGGGSMTIEAIPVSELKIGIHIILNLAWYEHPFLKNQFIISSEDEIKKIKGLGLKTIQIDLAKSKISIAPAPESPAGKEANVAVETIKTDTPIASYELLAIIHDTNLAPGEKANLIQQHSISMMKNLLENPTAENIQDVKNATSELVDLILKDDEITFYLINITDHDYNTYTHSVNVGVMAVVLAKTVFRHSHIHDLHALGAGFFLHDLGKVNIDRNIINKPSKLNDDEMQEMKRHPSLGFSLLQETKQVTEELKLIVLQHHEKLNGRGYPFGLRGEEIHIYGRICAIADVFDAMTSKRPYKDAMSSFAALKIMKDEMIPHYLQKDLFEKFVMLFKAP
jgi:HD-GYP domain-containing protein (c-di-GMP phosphodiesterase class II)